MSGWDEWRRDVRVVLDDGRELPVAPDAVDDAGFVRLRLGQRLSVELSPDGVRIDRVRMLG